MSDKYNASISAKELESIEKKKLSELQVIAKSIGIKRVTGVRKNDLIDQIREKYKSSDSPSDEEQKIAKKKPRRKAQKVNIEEVVLHSEPNEDFVEEKGKTSQKEDELTTHGGSSHIVSIKKKSLKKRKSKRMEKTKGKEIIRIRTRIKEREIMSMINYLYPINLHYRSDWRVNSTIGPYLVNEGTLRFYPMDMDSYVL